jgi:glycosyltransferase involved in cell wall biosynthesis
MLKKDMKLSIIIPCYNELKTLDAIINAVRKVHYSDKEIILIDDFSSDGTRELIKKSIETKVDKVIYHNKNIGKGAAVRSGLKEATGDIVVIQDADIEYDPEEILKLIEPILKGKADVVYGSRFVGATPHRVLYFWHLLGNKLLTTLSNIVTNITLTDMETCYKAFKREVIQSITIQENRFGFEPEITAKVARMNLRIYEVGVSYYGRTYEEGKKIGWKDGISALRCIIKYNFFRK